tara:strand:- start:74 stop:283 length:210 start_codon:yes stop_codon:yes gene_type:complete
MTREAELNIVVNNESGLKGPDTYTRIRLYEDKVMIHELMEKRSYEMAKMVARHWTQEGKVVQSAKGSTR